MKKFCITLILFAIIIVTIIFGNNQSLTSSNESYLRIHIRANSNEQSDQSIKLEIRDLVVNYLTPVVANCTSKQELETQINSNSNNLKVIIDNYLHSNNFNYDSNIYIANELFPTRQYEDLTLDYGYYDAIIIELGSSKGDNWWCVVYPPLCFTDTEDIVYSSKIINLIKSFSEN